MACKSEKWICQDCLHRNKPQGKDPIIYFVCSKTGNNYPYIKECQNRITLKQIEEVLDKVPYSILENHLKRRKEEVDDFLNFCG